jgi:zinc transporter 2
VHNHNEEKEHNCDHSHENSNEKATKNINVDAAYLHVLGDMIMSIGVCIAAVIIYFFPEYRIADPICTFIFSIIVCVTVQPIIKNCINILMEGSPNEINVE